LSAFPSDWQLHAAAHWVHTGGVIAYPTEAVFGLGCDPANRGAVTRLLTLKDRPEAKGLILIASHWEQLEPWLDSFPLRWRQKLEASWPGPVTWLIPARRDCPRWLRGQHDTLAVRVTAHALVRRLCDSLDSALVSTSANRSGCRPARSVLEVRLQFGRRIDFVLPGRLGKLGRPSQIRDLATGRVIRR
jgi:L-threonylcarbamoyladenylate synthase